MSRQKKQLDEPQSQSGPEYSGADSIPVATRLSVELPKPKDWQSFQRNCVVLFREELRDPHAQEYGRSGQDQSGIDVLGIRDGKDDHFVGVQCRLIGRPIKEKTILSDARKALQLKAQLKELIFATTAPDDKNATDAAIAVTKALKEEGYNVRVVVYGWGQLQVLISQHPKATDVFNPFLIARSGPQLLEAVVDVSELARQLGPKLIEELRSPGIINPPQEGGALSDEDPTLHARIDAFRDIFRVDREPALAEKKLSELLAKEDLSAKPWARYRLETNLGMIVPRQRP